MTTKIYMNNWDHDAKYEFGFGVGFHFSGKRHAMKKGVMTVTETNNAKDIVKFEGALAEMVTLSRDQGGNGPIFIVDDASPVSPDSGRLQEIIGDLPFLFFRLPRNLGCGGKENILQRVLSERCEYVVRYDADIHVENVNLEEVKQAFVDMPDAWAITSCITYFARLYASQLSEDVRYFSGSNIADFLVTKSSVYGEIGFSDPKLRTNDDGDLRLRALAAKGWKCYVDRTIGGKAAPSGAGADLSVRTELAQYVSDTRPFIKVIFPPGKTPRFTLNKKQTETAKGFTIPGHPFAEKLVEKVWA